MKQDVEIFWKSQGPVKVVEMKISTHWSQVTRHVELNEMPQY